MMRRLKLAFLLLLHTASLLAGATRRGQGTSEVA
jgi:hypothetical protein